MNKSAEKTINGESNAQIRREKRSRTEMEATTGKPVKESEVNGRALVVIPVSVDSGNGVTRTKTPSLESSSPLFAKDPFQFLQNALQQHSSTQHSKAPMNSFQMHQRNTDNLFSTVNKSTCAPPVPEPDQAKWKDQIMPHISRCMATEGIQASSAFAKNASASATSSTSRNNCLRRLLQELVALEEDLPDTLPGIWIRYGTHALIEFVVLSRQSRVYD